MSAMGATVAAGLLLAACAPSSGDFRVEAERFLRSDEVFDTYGLDLPDPSCADPTGTGSGTELRCTATAQDGVDYTFTFEITGRRRLTLQSIEFTNPP